MTLDEFENHVSSLCVASSLVSSMAISAAGLTWIRLRAYLVIEGIFIDIFYNEVNGKTSYALIQDNRRIFGADNTGGWHWHPFNSPDSHHFADTPIGFQEFMREVEGWGQKQN